VSSKIRLIPVKNSFIPLFVGLLFSVVVSSCTTLVKKEYSLLPQPEVEQGHLISLLEKEKNAGAVHGFGFYDSTNSKLWIRYFPKHTESADKVETYLLLKKFLNNTELVDETTPDSTADKTIEEFDSLYKTIQNNPEGEVLDKNELIEKVDSALETIEKGHKQEEDVRDSLI